MTPQEAWLLGLDMPLFTLYRYIVFQLFIIDSGGWLVIVEHGGGYRFQLFIIDSDMPIATIILPENFQLFIIDS